MKNFIRYILQRILGFDNYLFWFSLLSIKRLHNTSYEQEFLHFVDIIPNEGIILDIGANIGITTVPLAQKKTSARIYSFEPMPDNIRALKRVVNHFKLNNVQIFEAALGDSSGKLQMTMPIIGKVKMQGLSHIKTDDVADTANEVTVEVEKLDNIHEIITAHKISGIKIDVENFEYFVFKGAEKMLLKHKPLIYCELWENEKRLMTFEYLQNMGYSIKVMEKGQLVDFTLQNTINFFFIPKKVCYEI